MNYVAPIEINNLHDILYYAFNYFQYKTHDTFLNFFESNHYNIIRRTSKRGGTRQQSYVISLL